MDEPDFIGDWARERVLGCGSFGIVTLWKNIKDNDSIAIKKCRFGNESELTPKHRDRWTQEVDMMKRINNKNIVMFRDLPPSLEEELQNYNESKLPMLSMEYCGHGDLRSVLSKAENSCGLAEFDVRYILSDLMNAVSYLHSLKITHRDLKPENIVLQSGDRPNGIMYKLIDLGYAKEIDAKSVCASFVGTLQYLAPELLYSKSYSCSVDYWSMGLVAFEIMCGNRPFLPNMSPAQWMYHVHRKTSDIICIYQERDLTIVPSKEIYHENHISSCFKHEIEKWLQLALEYQPRKRGYLHYDPANSHNELAIFTSLEKLLEKKFVIVFVVHTCKRYSYEIDNCTQVTTLQGWVARDTKIEISEQSLVSECCDNIDLQGLATQFFDQTYRRMMLYVFKKGEILIPTVKPDFPDLVKFSLENPVATLPHYYQKKIFSQTLYFIYMETKLYNTVLDACSLKLRHMCKEINRLCKKMNNEIEKLNAQKDYSKEILDFDLKQYLKNYIQNANHWSEPFNRTSEKIDKLHGGCNQINSRLESTCRKVFQLGVVFDKNFTKHCDHPLNLKLDEAIECYCEIRSKLKLKSTSPEYARNMLKTLYDVLKVRDKLLRDDKFRNFLKVIVEMENDIEKMQKPIQSAIEHIEKFQKELITEHVARQKKIWEFTIKQKPKQKGTEVSSTCTVASADSTVTDTDTATPNALDNANIDKENIEKQGKIEKPLTFLLGVQKDKGANKQADSLYNSYEYANVSTENNSKDFDSIKTIVNNNYENVNISGPTGNAKTSNGVPNFMIGTPTSELIRYNLNLRHEIQEKTNESFIKYKSILNEDLDFSFLKE